MDVFYPTIQRIALKKKKEQKDIDAEKHLHHNRGL